MAYLLQKMESYPGAVILATNFRQNIDEAFLRRLDFVIDFPFPEPEDRERIWRLLLPAEAPLGERRRRRVPGARSSSCRAARSATRRSPPRSWRPTTAASIGMRHLVRGVALEYGKLGRLTLEAEFERFHELIR